MSDSSEALLKLCQRAYAIPDVLFREVERRGLTPEWLSSSVGAREDWLSSLHEAVTGGGNWPQALVETKAGLLDVNQNLGMAVFDDTARSIVMPISTPAYIWSTVEIVNNTLVSPSSSDTQAKMLLHGGRINEAARKLEFVLGMLEQIGYLHTYSHWNPQVIFGTRFLYYHELSHLLSASTAAKTPAWLVPGEEEIADELVADQFAMGMLALEVRNHKELQHVIFAGMAAALGFIALKEFAEQEYEGGVRRIKWSTYRMNRLLHWGRLVVKDGSIAREAVDFAEFYWSLLTSILRKVEHIESPIFLLLMQTAKRPETDWAVAANHVLCWCTFGDRSKVQTIIRDIRNSARMQAETNPCAKTVLLLIDYILANTRHCEPTLGLLAALKD